MSIKISASILVLSAGLALPALAEPVTSLPGSLTASSQGTETGGTVAAGGTVLPATNFLIAAGLLTGAVSIAAFGSGGGDGDDTTTTTTTTSTTTTGTSN